MEKITDTERLDFLENEYLSIDIDSDWCVGYIDDCGCRAFRAQTRGNTLRQAIDNAIMAMREKEND